MAPSQPELLLDANVFSDPTFLAWLRRHAEFSVGVPVIAYVELFLRSLRRGRVAELKTVLTGIRASVVPLDQVMGEEAAKQAVETPALPFRPHARDYLIGAAALHRKGLLVTYNTKHYAWMKASTRTPPQLLQGTRTP